MLIQFTVKNYLSFKEENTLTFQAENLSENITSTFEKNKTQYLKSIAIFGANAYGKTNFIKALLFFRSFIFNSYKNSLDENTSKIAIQPFLLNIDTKDKPVFMEIVFINNDNIQYRYNFQVDQNKILTEELYEQVQSERTKEKLVFKRNGDEIELGASFKEYKKFAPVKENVLFLTKLGLEVTFIDKNIFAWFRDFNVIDGYDRAYGGFTRNQIDKNLDFKEKVLKYLKIADFGIHDLEIEKHTVEDLKDIPFPFEKILRNGQITKLEKVTFLTQHSVFDNNGNTIGTTKFNLDDHESMGTNHFFDILGPIIDTLENGKVLVVDELDASLHPFVLKLIVDLFNSEKNTKNAQLIFTTHTVTLLDKNEVGENILRRDQIYFVDKNKLGESELFSLVDFKENKRKIRKDENYLKNYLIGKYGAIPFIDDYLND